MVRNLGKKGKGDIAQLGERLNGIQEVTPQRMGKTLPLYYHF
jgi:hypothetical protein